MRLFVALGIVVIALLLLAAKATRHHRRAPPQPEPEEAELEPPSPPAADRRRSPPARRAWSGPTLRELLDRAQAPAVIRGQARGPEGVSIRVSAWLTGKRERSRWIRVDNGAFEIPGLLFGRSYDLTFTGPDLRPTTLRSVTAPADGVEARLEPLPVLRGAIGFPAGAACSYKQVALRTRDAYPEDLVVVELDKTCRFELTVPDGPSQMMLVATGDGQPLAMLLTLPPVGDPDPVCLNPPCLADPLAGMARLRIGFAGADHPDLSATLTPTDGDQSSSYNCFTNGEDCELDALPVDQAFTLTAEAADCATATRTLALHAGDNDVSLPCQARSVQATVGNLDGDEAQGDLPSAIRAEIVDR
jgi:hypothetical protein